MLKVTFKQAIEIEQHGLIQSCLFVICNRLVQLGEKWTALIFEENAEAPFVSTRNIDKIEQVKPTDL